MKKFIFSKFEGLQAYSGQQLYYQTPLQVFFDNILSSPHATPCSDLSSPSNFEEHIRPPPNNGGRAQPPPMFTTPVLWETLTQHCSYLASYLSNIKRVKWPPYCSSTRCFELIAQPAILSARYALHAVHKSILEIWVACAQQPSLPELIFKFKLYAVCSYLILLTYSRYFKKLSF